MTGARHSSVLGRHAGKRLVEVGRVQGEAEDLPDVQERGVAAEVRVAGGRTILEEGRCRSRGSSRRPSCAGRTGRGSRPRRAGWQRPGSAGWSRAAYPRTRSCGACPRGCRRVRRPAPPPARRRASRPGARARRCRAEGSPARCRRPFRHRRAAGRAKGSAGPAELPSSARRSARSPCEDGAAARAAARSGRGRVRRPRRSRPASPAGGRNRSACRRRSRPSVPGPP